MARRRKHSRRKHSHRRHRMSGTGGDITNALAMVAGAVIGRVAQTKLSDKVNPKILAGGQIALGYFLPRMVKNKFVQGIGTGMIVNGGVSALQSFGVIAAINGIGSDVQVDFVSGDDSDDMMSGSADISIIAGDEEWDY